jgi:methanogenic corrinoid protein MtbC1
MNGAIRMKDIALKELRKAVMEGKEDLAAQAAGEALTFGITAEEVLNAISEAGNDIGRLFEAGDWYLPELFAGAEAMNAAVEKVVPELEKAAVQPKGTIIIGTVEGDVHEIGKRIVCAMLSGAGYRVYDLGTEVTAEQFVDKVRELNPDIVAASAYITTTCQNLPKIAIALREAGLREKVKYLIGGAAVNQGLLAWAGADAFGENAAQAVTVVHALTEDLKGD